MTHDCTNPDTCGDGCETARDVFGALLLIAFTRPKPTTRYTCAKCGSLELGGRACQVCELRASIDTWENGQTLDPDPWAA